MASSTFRNSLTEFISKTEKDRLKVVPGDAKIARESSDDLYTVINKIKKDGNKNDKIHE